MTISFDPVSFRYRSTETGRFTSRAELLALLDEETNRTAVRLQAHSRLLTSNKITLQEWETRFALTLKESALRTVALGAGGIKQLDSTHYGAVGQHLRQQYAFLNRFSQAIASGNVTEKQLLQRSAMYAASVRVSFHKSEAISRDRQGFYCVRLLDAQVRHCSSCIAHQRLEWTPVSQVVPPGVNCKCGGRCRCRLVFQRKKGILATGED